MVITKPELFPILARIDKVREHALKAKNRDELLCDLASACEELDEVLQRDLKKAYGDPYLRRGVPEWHKLMGSTPEYHDIPEEARSAVVRKVEVLVRSFEEAWGL